jgi:hypothetical protein
MFLLFVLRWTEILEFGQALFVKPEGFHFRKKHVIFHSFFAFLTSRQRLRVSVAPKFAVNKS